jgi:hypothetical protein
MDQDRLKSYANGVWGLRVEEYNHRQQYLNLERWLLQYPNLKEIQFTNKENFENEASRYEDRYLIDMTGESNGCWWNDTPFKSWNCISCKELYHFEGRTVIVEAERSRYKPFAQPTFNINHHKEIEWLGFVEIRGNQAWETKQNHVYKHLLQARDRQPAKFELAVKHLVALDLRGGYLTLDKLEKVLASCPDVTEFACTLNCRRVADVRRYMNRMNTLFRNSKVHKFQGKVGGADLLIFAWHLAVCSDLWLEGVVIWHDVTEIIGNTPVESAKLRRIVMKPHLAAGWLHHTICPIGVGKVMRAVFPPGTTVSFIESQADSPESHETLWIRALEANLEMARDLNLTRDLELQERDLELKNREDCKLELKDCKIELEDSKLDLKNRDLELKERDRRIEYLLQTILTLSERNSVDIHATTGDSKVAEDRKEGKPFLAQTSTLIGISKLRLITRWCARADRTESRRRHIDGAFGKEEAVKGEAVEAKRNLDLQETQTI